MKCAKWVSALTLFFVPLIAAAQMVPSERVVTQVPFQFMVGNVAVPAGECTIQLADEKGWVLIVGNQNGKLSIYTLAAANVSGKKAPASALVFHKYGNSYFLADLKIGDTNSVYTFHESKLEKELRAQNVSSTDVMLASAK
jgi:hypothetical protein